jgi:hypothetical protein
LSALSAVPAQAGEIRNNFSMKNSPKNGYDCCQLLPTQIYLVIVVGVLAVFALALFLMGQPVMCPCGYVQLWHSGTGEYSSMHLLDWYTWSHVIHGFIFYGLLSWLFPSWPRIARITVAIVPEVAWELVENSPWVIEYYRTQTAAAQYLGDSVINSVMDVVAMIAGAVYARFRSGPLWRLRSFWSLRRCGQCAII